MSRVGSIRRQLLILALAIGVPLLLGNILFIWRAYRDERRATEESTQRVSQAVAASLGQTIQELDGVLERASQADWAIRQPAPATDSLHRYLEEAHPLIIDAVFTDPAHRVQASSTGRALVEAPGWTARDAFRAGSPSAPFLDPIVHHWASALSRPVLDQAGRLRGYLAIAIDLEGYEDVLTQVGLPAGGTLSVIARDGTVIARVPDPERWVARNLRRSLAMRIAAERDPGVLRAIGLDGVDRLYAHSPIRGTDWVVFAGIPAAAAAAELRGFALRSLLLLAAWVLVAMVFAAAFVREVEGPIEHLRLALDRITRGEWDTQVPTHGPDELRRAATAMNDMIEARRKVEAQLQRSNQLLRTVLDSAREAVVFTGLDGRILLVSAAAAAESGRRPQELVGRHHSEVLSPERSKAFEQAMRRVFDSGQPEAEEELRDGQPTRRLWVVSRAPVRAPDGALLGMLSVGYDVTDRRRAEQDLRRLNETLRRTEAVSALGALVGGLAHEARNPLFAITATLDAMRVRFRPREELGPYIETLLTESKRLEHLMNDLLDYARAGAGALVPDHVPTAIESALQLSAGTAADAGVRITARTATGLPLVRMDRGLLTVAVRNLLENAIQHSPRGGTVEVETTATADGRQVAIQVLDEGPGFPLADLQQVFQPFRTRRIGGTGLGLVIVRRIVEDIGGHVVAQNRGGRGASVTMSLPAHQPEPLTPSMEAHS